MLELSIDYNSVTETLLIKAMPTRLLGCHLNWMHHEEFDWREQNLVTRDHLRLLRVGETLVSLRLWIIRYMIMLTLDSPWTIQGPVLGFEEVMHLLYKART